MQQPAAVQSTAAGQQQQQHAAARPLTSPPGPSFGNPFAIGAARAAPEVDWTSLSAADMFGAQAATTTGAATGAAPYAAAPCPPGTGLLDTPPGLPLRQPAKAELDELIYGPPRNVPPSSAAQVGTTPVLAPNGAEAARGGEWTVTFLVLPSANTTLPPSQPTARTTPENLTKQ